MGMGIQERVMRLLALLLEERLGNRAPPRLHFVVDEMHTSSSSTPAAASIRRLHFFQGLRQPPSNQKKITYL